MTNPQRRWTRAEDLRLCREYGSAGIVKMAVRLGRTPRAVRIRLRRLRPLRRSRRWTPQEDAVLRECAAAGSTSWKQATRRLPHRTLNAVCTRAGALGLRVVRQWTIEEDAVIEREWARGATGAARRSQAHLPYRSLKAIHGRRQTLLRPVREAAASMPAFLLGNRNG